MKLIEPFTISPNQHNADTLATQEKLNDVIEAINRIHRLLVICESAKNALWPEPKESKEPRIHSHIIDCLPENYEPLNDGVAPYKTIDCDGCGQTVHGFNNECMQTWIETKNGNFCTRCLRLDSVLEDNWPPLKDVKDGPT